MTDLTIVVANPDDDIVKNVRDIMKDWALVGLLKPFLWCMGHADENHFGEWNDSAHGDLNASDTEDANARDSLVIDVNEILTQELYRPMRVVVFLPLRPETSEPSKAKVWSAADTLRRVVCQAIADRSKVHSLGLLIPATRVTGIQPDSLSPDWDVHLVAADEDRITSEHAAKFVTHPKEHADHAAAILATAAGLWQGMEFAPFDGDGGSPIVHVRLIRSFIRVFCSQDLTRTITSELLARISDDAWLRATLTLTRAQNPFDIVARAADEYLTGPGASLTYRPYHSLPSKPLRRIDVRDVFTALRVSMRGRIDSYPDEVADHVAAEEGAREIQRFIQNETYGPNSAVQVTASSQEPMLSYDEMSKIRDGTISFAETLLKRIGEDPRSTAFGAVWADLRALSFGLVDGGPLPRGCTEPRSGINRAVVSPHAICPNPREEPFRLDHAPEQSGQTDQPAVRRSIEEIRPWDVAGAKLARTALAGHTMATTDKKPQEVVACLTNEFERWLEKRRRTLLWNIGDRINQGVTEAEEELLQALEILRKDSSEPDNTAVADPARSRRRWLPLTILGISGIGASGTMATFGSPAWISAAIVVLALTGLTGGVLLSGHRGLKQQFQRANHGSERVELLDACRKVGYAASEFIRLLAAYEQYTDWAKIIGTVLYHSAPEEQGRAVNPVSPRRLETPKAMQLAWGEIDEDRRELLAADVAKTSMNEGWIGRLYADIAHNQMELLKRRQFLSVHEPGPDPDSDRVAMGYLLGAVNCDNFDELVADWAAGHVAIFVSRQDPERLFTRLVDNNGNALGVLLSEFFAAIFPNANDRHDDYAHRMWKPRADSPVLGVGTKVWKPRIVHRVESATKITDIEATVDQNTGMVSLIAIRLDETKPLPPTDLKIFTDDSGQASRGSTLGGLG